MSAAAGTAASGARWGEPDPPQAPPYPPPPPRGMRITPLSIASTGGVSRAVARPGPLTHGPHRSRMIPATHILHGSFFFKQKTAYEIGSFMEPRLVACDQR